LSWYSRVRGIRSSFLFASGVGESAAFRVLRVGFYRAISYFTDFWNSLLADSPFASVDCHSLPVQWIFSFSAVLDVSSAVIVSRKWRKKRFFLNDPEVFKFAVFLNHWHWVKCSPAIP